MLWFIISLFYIVSWTQVWMFFSFFHVYFLWIQLLYIYFIFFQYADGTKAPAYNKQIFYHWAISPPHINLFILWYWRSNLGPLICYQLMNLLENQKHSGHIKPSSVNKIYKISSTTLLLFTIILFKAVGKGSTGKPLFCVQGNKMHFFFLYSTKDLLLAIIQA